MAKSTGSGAKVLLNNIVSKGTTIGHGLRKSSTLNKHKKRSYKAYRGQGK
jgi:hypothetical protein